ncbi:MAG: FG-GAP repeat domain-containing protein [Planctomycetota bacterium]
MVHRRPLQSRRLPRTARACTPVVEPLEPRALLTATPGIEFFRPVGIPAATEPTAYFDVSTGVLQMDPVGHNISLVNFTYNTKVENILGATPGPFVYSAGTDQAAVSTAAAKRTLPAGTWALLTTVPARLAGVISLTNTPTLATSGGNTASTNGWFNSPWNFGSVVAPNSLTVAEAERNFISITTTDIGYGPGRSLFHYTESGVIGSRYGRVVVYATADQASKANSIIGLAGDEIVVSPATQSGLAATTLATLPGGLSWTNSVSGDFDGDGRTDFASQTDAGTWWVTTNPTTGGANPRAWGGWAVFQFPTVGDFNADGKDDIAVRNATNGAWRVFTSTGAGFESARFGKWNNSLTWSNVLAGDFTGDGKDDLVGQRSDGIWVVAASTGTAFSSSFWATFPTGQFGTVGDYNADGRDDVAIRNPSNGAWRVLSSTGAAFEPLRFGVWDPTTTWSNVRAGDFNGDGRTDLVGQRAGGAWYVSTSTGSAFSTSEWTLLDVGQFPTVGDFNADGLDDLAVRNPNNGVWRLLASGGASFSSARFGSWTTSKAWSRAFAART